MSSWTPDRSVLLSLLMDEVTGTKGEIEIRQDYAKLHDCVGSLPSLPSYYTGSKAEGLNLPGSDDDFMSDINYMFNIKVTQSSNNTSATSSDMMFYLHTENVLPGFALLEVPLAYHISLGSVIERINGVSYLSSNLFAQDAFNLLNSFSKFSSIIHRQGPSMEHRMFNVFGGRNQEGIDSVWSIYCNFWPNKASEWSQRPRHFGWPTTSTVSSIISFGCHVVAVGHPHSNTNLTEWRISFSLAERTLVCSFNHIQIQCYAVLKIILKEFIKTKCSPQNQVLCSYFIKTFLFWKFETTETNFWRDDNFRECIMYSIIEFANCLQDGVLPHYFIPDFNLLSVKLTRGAQRELLQLYDHVIQCNMSILNKCKTLRIVWSKFLSADNDQITIIHDARKSYFMRHDDLMSRSCHQLANKCLLFKFDNYRSSLNFFCGHGPLAINSYSTVYNLIIQPVQITPISKILALSCDTDLKPLVVKQIMLNKFIESSIKPYPRNKMLYKLHLLAHKEPPTFDVSTSKLWYTIVLLSKGDFTSALSIVNTVLSSIPPFAFWVFPFARYDNAEAEQLYAETFMNSRNTIFARAGKAWLMPLSFEKYMTALVPLAIQIELFFSEGFLGNLPVRVSPFVMIHYLAFQCYHGLGENEKRDNALRQLLDTVNSNVQVHPFYFHSYNIAGHCLLIVGHIGRARDMFKRSDQLIKPYLPLVSSSENTAAAWYLQNFCLNSSSL